MTAAKSRVVKHTSIYMFGDILRYSTSLVMLPIYTRYLTPADYGVIELLSMLLDVAAIIFGARVGQSVFRFYCMATSEADKKNIVASALLLSFLFNGVAAVTVAVLSAPLSMAIFSDHSFAHYIALFSITLFFLPLEEIPFAHIRAQQKPWLFFTFSTVKLTLQVGLNIYLVVFKEMHIEGVIYSAVISGAIMAALLTGYSLPRTGMRATVATCRKLFSFSLPLKIATLGSFYLAYGDRYILNIFSDLSQVGIYALGYKFGFIFTMIGWTPFERMWDSEKYAIHKKPDAKQIYQKVFLYISSAMIFFGLCISLFVKDLLKIIADPAFLSAHEIVPIIIAAYIFQAFSKYCDLGILINQKTIQIAYAEWFAVVIITVAYFTLIPAYGMHGAAWATLIGFFARFYWILHQGRQHYAMDLPWTKVSLTATLAVVIFILSLLIPDDLVLSISLRALLVTAFIAIYFTLPILSRDEKKEIKQLVHSINRGSR